MSPTLTRRSLVLVLVLSASCGDDAQQPDRGRASDLFPSLEASCQLTCPGCCQGGVCKNGIENTSCGIAGNTCQVCNAPDSCKNGYCINETICQASTCPGCCTATGQCKTGSEDATCGKKGAACAVCSSGDTCLAGVCEPKTTGYAVMLVDGTVSTNEGCGWFDDCDPMVELTVAGKTYQSNYVEDSWNPKWNQTLTVLSAEDLKKGLAVELLDYDEISNDTIGDGTAAITDAILASGKVSVECWKSKKTVQIGTVNFTLTPTP